MLKIGAQFEGYDVSDVLGESSLNFSYLAETSGKQKVVLKIFKDDIFARDEGFSYLMCPRDAITQGKIANQTCLSFCTKVAVAEIPQIGKRAYLVRRYVEGNDLAEWKKYHRTWPEIKDILRRICQGLNHLHRADLIHGGLCPQDIIIGKGTVKVTDFGTAANYLSPILRLGEAATEKKHFLPPWHDTPEKFQSPFTDIYSLGAILYFLEKDIPLKGIPEDASLPVKKALMGEYKNIGEFFEGIESLPEEEEEGEEEQDEKEEEKKGREDFGGRVDKEEPDVSPEQASEIDIQREGIETEFSRGNLLLVLESIKRAVKACYELLKKLLSWFRRIGRVSWKWAVMPLAIILIISFHQDIINFVSPYVIKTKDYVSSLWPDSETPPEENITDQLKQIENNLLVRGKYLEARKELKGLRMSFPDNEEINTLLDRIGKKLSVPIQLILPPGQGSVQGQEASIPSGSGFKLHLIPGDTCYLNIYQLDSHNNLDQLFPNSGATPEKNPLRAGKTYRIPSGEKRFILDQNTGQETLYFVASRWPSRDLEELFEQFKNASGQKEKDTYCKRLIERIKARHHARSAGVEGCFYKEYAFQHE